MTGADSGGLWRPRFWPLWILFGLVRLLALLPLPVIWLLGGAVGALMQGLLPSARRIAATNLAVCFPALSPAARRRLLRQHFRALGRSLTGIGIAWHASRARLRRLVRYRDAQYFTQAQAQNRNVILLAPHFVGLDVGGVRLSSDQPVVSMYRAAKNPLVDRMLRRRARFGAVLVERSANLKSLIKLIRGGMPFYYLPDQDPGGAEHVFAPFFGEPTATLTALGRIARLGDAVVIPCATRIRRFGRGFDLCFYPPMAPFTGDALADATAMNAAVEATVRDMPAQYLWVYKRFKTREVGSGRRYA